jgi:hypothetical protein
MTAISNAAQLCRELDRRYVAYQLLIVRDEVLMISVAVPGERWEIEFFEDGHVELERFLSQGVVDAPDVQARIRSKLDE